METPIGAQPISISHHQQVRVGIPLLISVYSQPALKVKDKNKGAHSWVRGLFCVCVYIYI